MLGEADGVFEAGAFVDQCLVAYARLFEGLVLLAGGFELSMAHGDGLLLFEQGFEVVELAFQDFERGRPLFLTYLHFLSRPVDLLLQFAAASIELAPLLH